MPLLAAALASWPGSELLAATLLLEDFESPALPPADSSDTRDGSASSRTALLPGPPPPGWELGPEGVGVGSLRIQRDPGDVFNQTLLLESPGGEAVLEVARRFPVVSRDDFSSALELRVRLRVGEDSRENRVALSLENATGRRLIRLLLGSDDIGSGASLSVEAAASPGGAAVSRSLLKDIRPGAWYEVTLRADMASRLADAEVRNLNDAGPQQSARLGEVLYLLDPADSVDRMRLRASSHGTLSLDRLRVRALASSDLMRFGRFELWSSNVPTGWSLTRGSDSGPLRQRESPRLGDGALTLTKPTVGATGALLALRERIPVTGGTRYRVRYSHRVEERRAYRNHSAVLEIRFHDAAGREVSRETLAGWANAPNASWAENFRELLAPANAVSAGMTLEPALTFAGSVSVDELSFTRMPDPRLRARPGGRQFDFVGSGESASPGFTAVRPDKRFDERVPKDYGWSLRGNELPKYARRDSLAAYPSFLQSRSVQAASFSVGLPESEGSSTQYRVSIFAGCLERVPGPDNVNDFSVNGVSLGDGAKTLDQVMDDEYFRFVHDAEIDGGWLERGSERVYEDYLERRFKRYDATVRGFGGKLVFESRQGCMNGVVLTQASDAAAHDAAVAEFEAQQKDAFIARWAEQLPSNPLRGARRGSHQPEASVPYVVFQRPWMEAVEYDSRPDASDLVNGVELSATPGEYEPATFSIWPRRSFDELRIDVEPLRGPGGASIPASAVSVWAVQQKPYRTRLPATGFRIEGVFLPDWHDRDGAGRALYKDMVQRVWLSVHVPQGAKPGVYSGNLTLRPVGGEAPARALGLKLVVRPFRLERPKRLHALRGGGGDLRIPYPDRYDSRPSGPAGYASIGKHPRDSRTHEFYRKAALDDLYRHGFIPELWVWWRSFFDPRTGKTDWDAESWATPLRNWVQLIKDSPHGATGDLWIDAANLNLCCLVEAFDRAAYWTPADVARYLQMLYRDLGPESDRSFGGFRRILLSATAEESHYGSRAGSQYRAWLSYLAFVRNGDSEHDPKSWGNGAADPADNTIQTVHSFNTDRGHEDAVRTGLVDRPYLGMFHGVGEIDDLPTHGARQVGDVQSGRPFGLYGNRGRFVGGYYLWRASLEHDRANELGTYHEFYSRYYGSLNNDWDESMQLLGGYEIPLVRAEGPAWVLAIPSDTGRMIGTWYWEELREGVDDEAYLLTLQHWIDVSAGHASPAVEVARREGRALLRELKASIELDVDPTRLLSLDSGNSLYRPIPIERFDVWRDRVAAATERIIAAVTAARPEASATSPD